MIRSAWPTQVSSRMMALEFSGVFKRKDYVGKGKRVIGRTSQESSDGRTKNKRCCMPGITIEIRLCGTNALTTAALVGK